MAQTKKRRSRKHRGTQAGTVERPAPAPARGGGRRPAGRGDVKRDASQRRSTRFDTPPTWRGAFNRAAIMAAVFALLAILVLGRTVPQGVILGAFMLLLYVPMSYYTDRLLYRRRQRTKAG